MNRQLRLIMGLSHFLLLAAFFMLFYISLGYVNPGPKVEQIKHISNVQLSVDHGKSQEVRLPYSLWDLTPGTPVTVTATIYPEPNEEIFVESRYCPGKVYLDGKLRYEFGAEGQYPSFMLDPATEVHMIETLGSHRAMELRIEFLSPKTQKRMVLEAPLLGATKEIILDRFHTYGITCVLAAAQMIYGFSLLLVSFATQFLDKKGVSFFWLGLLSLTTGMWAMCENNFSDVIFKNSTLLYICSFSGFFTFVIPLLRFSRSIVDYENPKPIWYLELFMAILGAAALILQLLGIVAFTSSMLFFYLVLPGSLVFLTAYTVRDSLMFHNVNAGRFILPVGILTGTSILGLIGYLSSINYMVSSLTQMGILLFLLLVGVIAGRTLKDNIYFRNKQKELKFEKSLMDIQARDQKSHSDLIAHQEKLLSQQRHDLRHHLNVIKALASEENQELQEYLQTIMDNIPSASRKFCENQAVNAILSHFSTLCQQKGITLTLDLAVPENNPHISDSDLCVIFGNLLENAVEACDRLGYSEKFIRLNSQIQYELLVITMDNSFNGMIQKEDDRFRSAKRDDFGIGLTSIQSVARKAGGNASFQGDGKVFLSSVYLTL